MAGVTLVLPPKPLLGHLKQPANINALYDWAKTTHQQHPSAQWIVALDTLVYGGLIPSRLGDESKDDLLSRWQQWLAWFENNQISPHGIASILRIPAYNNSAEEPDYWATYGEKLHQLSVALHRDGMIDNDDLGRLPSDVFEHFLATRARNMAMHHKFIEALQHQQLASVVWGEDDTGAYGLNRLEAEQLETLLRRLELNAIGRRQTGADEVASTLLTRLVLAHTKHAPRVAVQYTHPQTAHHTAKFDGISFTQLAKQQLAACGAEPTDAADDADLILLLHTPPSTTEGTFTHGDWCETNTPSLNTDRASLTSTLAELAHQKPLIIADVVAANGGDPELLSAMQHTLTINQLYGYAGWNTPGNSVGSALALGCSRWWSQQQGNYYADAFAHALLTRFIDDGLYQPIYRGTIPSNSTYCDDTAATVTKAMATDITAWQQWCGLSDAHISISFPCQRQFEVAVNIG